jgi:quercetin dioxygenase-like cupin family protein
VIIEGKGIVADESQEYVVVPGDVVAIPTNEKHWHGATETTGMTHVAINQEGEATVLEAVDKIKTQNP